MDASTQGVTQVVREFYANLPHRDDKKVYVWGVWVPFDSVTINNAFEMKDNDTEAYRKRFQTLDYDKILKSLTNGKIPWTKNANNELASFLRTELTPKAWVWFYFISHKVKPSKHVSTMRRDKSILIYAILKDIQFDIGFVIEISILEAISRRCTGALAHPPLITLLWAMEGLNMSDSEEKFPLMLPLPMPKKKMGSFSSIVDIDNEESGERNAQEDEQEESDSEEEEEQSEKPIYPRIFKLIDDFAQIRDEEYIDYKRSNSKIHIDNDKIMLRLAGNASRVAKE